MKILTTTIVGAALMVGFSAPARANQLTYFVTVAQIQSAFTASTFTGNCTLGFQDCGIYGIGIKSDTAGGANLVLANSFGVASSAPANGQADAWITKTINSANPGFEAGGGPADTSEAFITLNQHLKTTAGTYDANAGVTTALPGAAANSATLSTGGFVGMLSATTTLYFTLDYGSTFVSSSVPDNITFEVLGVSLNATTGVQGTKGLLGTLTVNSLVATPEPSSLAMLFGGIAAVGLSRIRRQRNS